MWRPGWCQPGCGFDPHVEHGQIALAHPRRLAAAERAGFNVEAIKRFNLNDPREYLHPERPGGPVLTADVIDEVVGEPQDPWTALAVETIKRDAPAAVVRVYRALPRIGGAHLNEGGEWVTFDPLDAFGFARGGMGMYDPSQMHVMTALIPAATMRGQWGYYGPPLDGDLIPAPPTLGEPATLADIRAGDWVGVACLSIPWPSWVRCTDVAGGVPRKQTPWGLKPITAPVLRRYRPAQPSSRAVAA